MTLITLSILSFSRSICPCLLLPYLVGIDLSLSSSTISRWHTIVLFLILNLAAQMAGWFAGEKACVLSGCYKMRLIDLGSTRCRSEGYFLSPGATAGSSVRICARAATGGVDVWQLRRRSGDGVVELPAAHSAPSRSV